MGLSKSGYFTLPGEAGYEELTLSLAGRWHADVIRDSDGTHLSEELLNAGYGIYSTICIIRGHNEWIKQNMDVRQQCFLCTDPRTALGPQLSIRLMDDFFEEQFSVHGEALNLMQVFDRTSGEELPPSMWNFSPEEGRVDIQARPFHRYTVSFLAWRNWEEISMYNHTTNGWGGEHLLQLDPYHEKAMGYIETWLDQWCREHPYTNVVRLTSLFYNFAWIWGSQEACRHRFTDWASYDFTVSVPALMDFEKEYGYALTAEDFVNGGKYRVSHIPATKQKKDWMDFVGRFVRRAGRRLVDIIHAHGKQAYVFYDDSWVGLEPYSGCFEEFGFDGLIKCVFSGFEVRLCAGVEVDTHEIRLHPYLFPVGLGGAPTFSEGGRPHMDAMDYWLCVRRALLHAKIDRLGLGGYLHHVKDYPEFVLAMDGITREFGDILALHEGGSPLRWGRRVGILTAWGKLRSWTLSGHFHETKQHVLMHILESLSGMPLELRFLSFEDVQGGALSDVDVLINAGKAGSAWSGGNLWQNEMVQETVTAWVHAGGTFLGVQEPSAATGGDVNFRMAHVLGVDLDTGERCCHGKWPVKAEDTDGLVPQGVDIQPMPNIYLVSQDTEVVLADKEHQPLLTRKAFGKGWGYYLAGYQLTPQNTRLLQGIILGESKETVAGNLFTECAVYPSLGKLAFVNNTRQAQMTACTVGNRSYEVVLPPCGMKIVDIEHDE